MKSTQKLQQIRLEKGFSQSGLSESAGVSLKTLQKYESKALDINGAKLLTLLKLCNALDCRLEDILDDSETLAALERYNGDFE